MKPLTLAYVLRSADLAELEAVAAELLHYSTTGEGAGEPPTKADCRRLYERLALLTSRATACPEMRPEPMVPRIEGCEPLTEGEIRALDGLGERLVILLPPLLCDPDAPEQDGHWARAYLTVQRKAPADEALLIASLRKVLMFEDARGQHIGRITLALRSRVGKAAPGSYQSDPEGWLEYLLSFEGRATGSMPFVIGCLQRTLYAKPEFHS